MFFAFSKLVQPVLWPFNIALLLLLAALVALYREKIGLGRKLLLAAVIFLVVPAFPFIAFGLLNGLESKFPVISSNDVSSADAIVVLGGTIWGTSPPRLEIEEGSGSRLVPAARIYRRGKAPFVVVSSGVEYLKADGTPRSEAEDMRDFLIDQGIPGKVIVTEGRSRNTDENAKYVSEIGKERGWKKVILVTSAFHITRAVAVFKKYGVLEVIPFPTEKRVTNSRFRFRDLIPDLTSLQITTACIKEHVGRWVYQ